MSSWGWLLLGVGLGALSVFCLWLRRRVERFIFRNYEIAERERPIARGEMEPPPS